MDGPSTMDDDDEEGRMASAAIPACSGSLLWQGLNGIFGLTSGLCSKSGTSLSDSIDEISALILKSGWSGARGRRSSCSFVSRGGQSEEEGSGGAELL